MTPGPKGPSPSSSVAVRPASTWPGRGEGRRATPRVAFRLPSCEVSSRGPPTLRSRRRLAAVLLRSFICLPETHALRCQPGQRPPWCFLTKGAGVQTGKHRVNLLRSHICSACHVLQLRRGAGMQKFATARWLVNGCQSTPSVHIRKGNPSGAKPKVRDNRMNPNVATQPHEKMSWRRPDRQVTDRLGRASCRHPARQVSRSPVRLCDDHDVRRP